MIFASLVLAVGALAGANPDAGYDRVAGLLAERRLSEAHDGLTEIADPLLAARATADLWYYARDFEACLSACEEGLAREPGDLILLYRAVSSALWSRDGERSTAFAERLGGALERANLTPAERESWSSTLSSFRADADRLLDERESRERHVTRGRRVALAILAASLVVLLALAWRR